MTTVITYAVYVCLGINGIYNLGQIVYIIHDEMKKRKTK